MAVPSTTMSTSTTSIPNPEEWIDRYLHRPVASVVVSMLVRTSVTPNQVTLSAALVGLFGGMLIGLATPMSILCGGAMLWCAVILDCVDGQLARARGGGTLVGRVLDGLADLVIASAGHVGLLVAAYAGAIRFCGEPTTGWTPFLWMVAAGVSMIVHANLVDYHKGRLLRLSGITSGATHARSEAESAHQNANGWFEKRLLAFYVNYCAFQETLAHSSSQATTKSYSLTADQLRLVREQLLGPTRAWTWLGPSTRMAVLILCIWAAPLASAGIEFYVGIGAIFANIFGIFVWIWITRANAKLAEQGII